MKHPQPTDLCPESVSDFLCYYLLHLAEERSVTPSDISSIIAEESAAAERSPGRLQFDQDIIDRTLQKLEANTFISTDNDNLNITAAGRAKLREYESFQEQDSFKDKIAQTLLQWMGPAEGDENALDVGTGQGYLALQVADMGYDVLGIDPEKGDSFQGWLDNAREKAREHDGTIDFQKASIEDLAGEDFSFNYIVSSHAIHHMDNKKHCFQAVSELLTAGGTFISMDLDVSAHGFLQHGWHCFCSVSREQYKSDLPQYGLGNIRFLQKGGYLLVAAEKNS